MPAAPLDILNTVMNASRVRLNDAIETLSPVSGKLLENTQTFSQQTVNTAWRRMQEFLANLGYSKLKNETTFTAVPATGSTDPITASYISWSTFYDGANTQVAPVLPQDLIVPLDLWERPTGTTQSLTEMDRVLNGLPKVPKVQWNRQWEWRDDMVYIPGATVSTDIVLRYAAYISDFVDNSPASNTPWFGQAVPIERSLDSFAWYICDEIDRARNDNYAGQFVAPAEHAAMMILNRDTLGTKQIYKASEYSKMADRFTPNSGPDTQPVRRGQ